MSSIAEVATLCAIRDRDAQALLLLDVAVKSAVLLIRDGEPGRAEYVMARAGQRADRLFGGHA